MLEQEADNVRPRLADNRGYIRNQVVSNATGTQFNLTSISQDKGQRTKDKRRTEILMSNIGLK